MPKCSFVAFSLKHATDKYINANVKEGQDEEKPSATNSG